jgi:hypothetical protein
MSLGMDRGSVGQTVWDTSTRGLQNMVEGGEGLRQWSVSLCGSSGKGTMGGGSPAGDP